MWFDAYLRNADRTNADIRLVYNLMNGNFDFPSQATERSIELFIEKHQFPDFVKIAFQNVFSDFSNVQYATIIRRRRKKIA